MGKFKEFVENKYTGTPYAGWQDRKPDQMAFNNINAALQHLGGSHPELGAQLQALQNQFAHIWDKIQSKHMGNMPN